MTKRDYRPMTQTEGEQVSVWGPRTWPKTQACHPVSFPQGCPAG